MAAEKTVANNLQDAIRRTTLVSSINAMDHLEKPHPTLMDILGPYGFTDARGGRWSLSAYARMILRTGAHEALTEGTMAAMVGHGYDVVKVSATSHPAAACAPYDGKIFSLSKESDYPQLDKFPPFHPECQHFMYRYMGSQNGSH